MSGITAQLHKFVKIVCLTGIYGRHNVESEPVLFSWAQISFITMPSKRTASSKSPLDSTEARKTLASIKRDLRRVEREVKALSGSVQVQGKTSSQVQTKH